MAHHGGFERRGICEVIEFVVGQHGWPGMTPIDVGAARSVTFGGSGST
jgi:hypothetical protein